MYNFDLSRQLYRYVSIFPGSDLTALTRITGLPRGRVEALLPGMDGAGFLLSEDEHGGLFPYRTLVTSGRRHRRTLAGR